MQDFSYSKAFGLILGPILAILIYNFPHPKTLSIEAWQTIAITILMITWWMTEAIPIPITALMPLIAVPILNIAPMKEVASSYGNPIIFLFLGGFLLALAMERWKLHIRIALNIIAFVGTHPNGIVAGFMLATAFLSMWMSNTATTVMMLPIALSVITLLQKDQKIDQSGKGYRHFYLCLMLGIAYAANIGGTATLIGTPPNVIFSGFMLDQYNVDIGFLQWSLLGLPFASIMLILTWLFLTKILHPNHLGELHGGKKLILKELEALGKMTRGEKIILCIFCLTAFLWILRPTLKTWFPTSDITDSTIAIFGATLLFIIPVQWKKQIFVLDWKASERLPWGVLLLFGGGLSLASTLSNTGVIDWIGDLITQLDSWSFFWIGLVIITIVLFMTELMSNMALTAIFLPVAAALAIAFKQNPLITTIPITFAASCAFMLPMATPPNAIVFASGHVTIPQMARTGILLNMLAIMMITLLSYSLLLYIFHVELNTIPAWAG